MSDDDRLEDVADAILDGASVDWEEVTARAGSNLSLVASLKVLASLADVHRDSAPAPCWGHFELIEPLGHGAFGRVFRARDTRLDRDVALKLLDAPSASDDARASSILNEGRLLAQVRHPNVVTIHGAARIGDQVGLWMELIHGRTLQTLLDQSKRFTVAETVDIGCQLCDAVAAVHGAGVLHRDIKAANVMLADDGRVVLMDFGTGWNARDISSAVPAGTPLYLAPELLAGGEPTVQSDVYAMGVVLFLLLTGRYPVTGRVIEELKQAHASRPHADLRARRPDVSRRYATVIERAIAPVPAHRYATAASFATELHRAHRPVSRWIVAATLMVVVGALLAAQAYRPSGRSLPAARAAEEVTAAIRPVTSTPGEKWHPAISPDGSRVVYPWKRDGVWGIYVTEIEGGRTWQVSGINEAGSYPKWAPDGRSVAFIRGFVTDRGGQSVVRVAAADAPQLRTLWQTAAHLVGSGLSWSPDGRHLALSVKPSVGQPLRIMLLDVGTLVQRWLTDPDRTGGDTIPAFSPDGASLAFVRSTGEMTALHVVQLDSGQVRRLDVGQHHVDSMTWSDDGRSLIFTSLRAGARDSLWRVSSAGGEPQPIAGVGEGARSPSATPTGRLVYLQQVVDSNIYRAELTGAASVVPQQLPSSTRVESSPDISPDGLRIAFTSSRHGSPEVWQADVDGTNARQLTTLGTTTHPRWSPDGQRLACAVGLTPSSSSASSIYVIDASSGTSRRLTHGTALEKWPTWSADGQSIYFGSNRSGSWQIWKISAAGGDPDQVTRNGGLKAWESSDGAVLYYSSETGGQTAIWRTPVDGGTPSMVFPFPRGTAWGGEWILKPGGIYWVNERVGPQIEFFSFSTSRSVPVLIPKGPYDHGSGFSVSNDGRWILFSGMDYHGTDIMMVDKRPIRQP